MSAITFDTLKFSERLIKAGVPEAHAKAEAEALAEALASGTHEIARKSDLREMEARINGDLKLLKWMLAAIVVAEVAPLLKQLFSA